MGTGGNDVTVYSIRNWDTLFENNRSRQVEALKWVPMPNNHDGSGFVDLLDHEEGVAHYGCWALIVQVASKCNPRGDLVKSSGDAHTPESLAKVLRVPEKTMKNAIVRLVKIGWIQHKTSGGRQVDVTPTSLERQADVTSTSGGRHLGDIEEKGIEGKEEKGRIEIPAELSGSRDKILAWLSYKAEKGQTYKPKGLKAFFSGLLAQFPTDEARNAAIDSSMMCNYAGVFPAKGATNGQRNDRTARVEAPKGKYDNVGVRVSNDPAAPRPEQGS
jgi:hypothetical protein